MHKGEISKCLESLGIADALFNTSIIKRKTNHGKVKTWKKVHMLNYSEPQRMLDPDHVKKAMSHLSPTELKQYRDRFLAAADKISSMETQNESSETIQDAVETDHDTSGDEISNNTTET